MGDKTDLLDLFLDTLDPQQRLNMTLAMKLDLLSEKMDGEEKEDDDISDELLDLLGQDVVKTQEAIREMQHDLAVLRGAVEETIHQLHELQGGPKASKPTPAEVTAAVRETQAKAATGFTEKGARSKAKAFRGVYCRNCAKELTGKHQSLFCSRRCAAVWRGQHPDEVATPRLSVRENDFEATVVAGEGVRA